MTTGFLSEQVGGWSWPFKPKMGRVEEAGLERKIDHIIEVTNYGENPCGDSTFIQGKFMAH